MKTINLLVHCSACNGVGIRRYTAEPNGPVIEEDPCSYCDGSGKMPSQFFLDGDILHDIKKIVKDIQDKVEGL